MNQPAPASATTTEPTIASRDPASEAALIGHVAYLRHGRVALIAPLAALERARLPLSLSGMAALTDMKFARNGAPRMAAT